MRYLSPLQLFFLLYLYLSRRDGNNMLLQQMLGRALRITVFNSSNVRKPIGFVALGLYLA